MARLRLTFCECEHSGDLDMYISDVVDCGGTIVERSVDACSEKGTLIVETPNLEAFRVRLRKTASWDFCVGGGN